MPVEDIRIRPATRDDANAMAELINMAGEGLPLYLWERMASDEQSAWEIGSSRAARDEGGFSWRNTIIAEVGGELAGNLVGYAQPAEPEPVDPESTPAMFIPILELENLAPGSWYINALAVYPNFRGAGIGTKLLAAAEEKAREAGLRSLSVIVTDDNAGARRLYERCGYRECASRAMVKEDWESPSMNWVLLIKPIHLEN